MVAGTPPCREGVEVGTWDSTKRGCPPAVLRDSPASCYHVEAMCTDTQEELYEWAERYAVGAKLVATQGQPQEGKGRGVGMAS